MPLLFKYRYLWTLSYKYNKQSSEENIVRTIRESRNRLFPELMRIMDL